MDTATILATMGRDAPEPIVIDTKAYGPWFHMMSCETTQSDQQLGGRDIGSLNLEAALGLPGAENLNLDACVEKLNAWAKQVRAYTQDHWYLFQRSPEEYDFSRGHFLMLALVTFLQKHLDVHYNLSFNEGEYNATDSRNLFLHGVLSGHGGTCATMPVLYIAIGRRLGYPLYLVRAKEHMFARWEEPGGERFNIECTSPGFRPLDDEYYHRGPRPLTAEDLRAGNYLRNLRPREELAQFLCERTRCLIDHLHLGEALLSSCLAGQLAVEDPGVRGVWSVATVMAHALEKARRKAGLDEYWGLDLRSVPVPDGNDFFERWAAPAVRESLQRIARIRGNARASAHSQLFGALGHVNDQHFPHTKL
ncbi:MAG: transglutaminase family protein [Thermoguttaceae bacterium]